MSTFLYSAVTHACLNRMRNGKTRERLLALHGDVLAPSDRGRPSAEQLFQLRALIERLPEPLAQVAVYRFMDELTHEEIAEIMGCSRRHVGDLLKRLDDSSEARESAE